MTTCVLVDISGDISKCLMYFFSAGRLDEVMEMTLQQILRSWQPLVSCEEELNSENFSNVKRRRNIVAYSVQEKSLKSWGRTSMP